MIRPMFSRLDTQAVRLVTCEALAVLRRQFVLCLIERLPSPYPKFLCFAIGLTQRLLTLLDKFLTMCHGTVQYLCAVIDGFFEFIFCASRSIAKKPAQLRACLWCEKQGDTRADQRSYKKSREIY